MLERRVADERLELVVDRALPAVVAAPGELTVDPDPEPGGLPDGVVFEADVRVEESRS